MTTITPRAIIATAAVAFIVTLSAMTVRAQTVQTSRLMRQKLAESQELLAAVVTSNWAELDRHARALEALTNQPGWDALRMPEYHDQTVAFQRALAQLTAAGGQRDQTSAVAAYNSLVTSCVACHRYVARARIATAN